jgi:phosphoglucomutase
LFQKLIQLYLQYGFYKEHLISITKKGRDGQQQIADMMERFRNNPPKVLAGSNVIELLDYEKGIKTNLQTKDKAPIELPKSNVLQFILEDGSKISARPSGTEPKIKFYFSVNTPLATEKDFEKTDQQLKQKIDTIIKEMEL